MVQKENLCAVLMLFNVLILSSNQQFFENVPILSFEFNVQSSELLIDFILIWCLFLFFVISGNCPMRRASYWQMLEHCFLVLYESIACWVLTEILRSLCFWISKSSSTSACFRKGNGKGKEANKGKRVKTRFRFDTHSLEDVSRLKGKNAWD